MATEEDFFANSKQGMAIFQAIKQATASIGNTDIRISKSQIAFYHNHGFAYIWQPGMYVKTDKPIVLSIALNEQIVSPRFKEVVQPAKKHWIHHIEIESPSEIDEEIVSWLKQAYREAALKK